MWTSVKEKMPSKDGNICAFVNIGCQKLKFAHFRKTYTALTSLRSPTKRKNAGSITTTETGDILKKCTSRIGWSCRTCRRMRKIDTFFCSGIIKQ